MFFSTINFLEIALGITNPKIQNITINTTIDGLIENKNKSEIIKDINEDITKNMLLSKLSSIIFISL